MILSEWVKKITLWDKKIKNRDFIEVMYARGPVFTETRLEWGPVSVPSRWVLAHILLSDWQSRRVYTRITECIQVFRCSMVNYEDRTRQIIKEKIINKQIKLCKHEHSNWKKTVSVVITRYLTFDFNIYLKIKVIMFCHS